MFVEKITKNKVLLFLICVVTITFICFIDFITGYKVQITILYVLPIYLCTWYIGKPCGLFISLLCSLSMLLANFMAENAHLNYIIMLWNIFINFMMFAFISFVLWKLKVNVDMNYNHARIDFLTNIPNRMGLYENSLKVLDRCKKDNLLAAVAFIDCDNFKRVNDETGHEIGDTVLQVVAHTIKTNLRTLDIVARLGGDEFVIMLTGENSDNIKSAIHRINEKLIDAMNERKLPVTFSTGLIIFNKVPDSIDKAIKMADDLMYQVKRNGKNAVLCQEVD